MYDKYNNTDNKYKHSLDIFEDNDNDKDDDDDDDDGWTIIKNRNTINKNIDKFQSFT